MLGQSPRRGATIAQILFGVFSVWVINGLTHSLLGLAFRSRPDGVSLGGASLLGTLSVAAAVGLAVAVDLPGPEEIGLSLVPILGFVGAFAGTYVPQGQGSRPR